MQFKLTTARLCLFILPQVPRVPTFFYTNHETIQNVLQDIKESGYTSHLLDFSFCVNANISVYTFKNIAYRSKNYWIQ